jgi:arylsulfatase A
LTGKLGMMLGIFTVVMAVHMAAAKPNIVFLMADDLGYGDLSGFGGNPVSETPHLDQMVKDGMRFVSMYSASPVCSPSRSSVMTGRYMTRNGVWPGVFYPDSIGGLALNETMLPALLRDEGGYDTFMAGKWHLGVGAGGQYLPYNRGFSHYYGVPYGIDMCSQDTVRYVQRDGFPAGACLAPNISCYSPQWVGGHANGGAGEHFTPCPFYVNDTIMEQPTALLALDDKYVTATVTFIEAHKDPSSKPFFVYFASHHTHGPAFAKANFTNTSIRGWFGDHLRTLDWSVGEIIAAIDR